MLDLFDLPTNGESQWFWSNSSVGSTAETRQISWTKPRGAKFVYIYIAGAGGGGGGGASLPVDTAKGGGGGGGACGYQVGLFPAHMLPDVLLIDIGAGGTGGAADNDGTVGGTSFVSFPIKNSLTNETLFRALGGNGGFKGTATGGARGDTAATYNQAGYIFLGAGIPGGGGVGAQSQNGTAGSGSSSAASNSNTGSHTGGCGGGGVTVGNVAGDGGRADVLTVQSIRPHVAGVAGLAATPVNGRSGNKFPAPFANQGGAGGAGSAAGTGGTGGDGAWGSGGGGGGAGITGGAGGNGGGGFALIVCL